MPALQVDSLRLATLLAGAGLIAFAGCSSTAATTVPVTHPTMISVSPQDFLGDVPCSSSGPGLKRYVATLFDLNQTSGGYGGEGGEGAIDDAPASGGSGGSGGGLAQFQSPSSAPTPCLAGVGFGFVVAGRHYRVELDGYDTDDLAPRASGSRQMVSPAPTPEQPVTPLLTPVWQASCERAIAVDLTIVPADQCSTLSRIAGAGSDTKTGELRVALAPLLGNLACGSEASQVDHFEVSATAGGTTLSQTVPCTATAQAVFAALPARLAASVYVTAHSAAAADPTVPLAGASCHGNVLPGVAVDADCAQLSQLGTVRLDVNAALGELSLGCTAGQVSTVQIQVADQPAQSLAPPSCLQPFDQGFAPGTAVFTVTASKDGDQLGSLTCHASAQPGLLVSAQCDVDAAE